MWHVDSDAFRLIDILVIGFEAFKVFEELFLFWVSKLTLF